MRREFRPDIQGLRAIAVLLVVAYHTDRSILPGGYVGVDVFFAISGYLITSHLIDGLERDGKVKFVAFYARRVRRILPASFVVLVLTLVASFIWLPPIQLQGTTQVAIATALYVPNMLFAIKGTDYLADTAPSVFQQYWSLGVEEQFYLVWPALIAIAFLLVRKSRHGLLALLVVTVMVSFVLGVIITGKSQPWAFFSLPTRAWELGAGGTLAVLLQKRHLPNAVSLPCGWLGIAAVLGSAALMSDGTLFPGYWAAVPVCGSLAVIASGVQPTSIAVSRVLGVRPFQFIGNISYSVYLVHWPLLVIPITVAGSIRPLPVWQVVVLGAASLPIGYLSYRFVEVPFRRPRGLERPRRVLSLVAASSLLIVGISLVGREVAAETPMTTGELAPIAALSPDPVGTAFVPANLQPALRDASADNPVIYSTGCVAAVESADVTGCDFGSNPAAPRVALFGDSHAVQWFPALLPLAESGDILLEVHTKRSCASAFINVEQESRTNPTCPPWRRATIAQLQADPPAAVILANFAFNNTETDPDPGTSWRQALQETVDELDRGSRIAIIADTPNMADTPAICLSAHVDDVAACTWPVARVLHPVLETAEQEVNGATWLDFNTYICNSKTCPPIIGNSLVYRDAHHLTATFASRLAPVVGPKILSFVQNQ